METPLPAKRTRGRQKSASVEKVTPSEEENAPNVNGDKDGEVQEASSEENEVREKDNKGSSDEQVEEKTLRQSRKRKASEMKSDNSNVEEKEVVASDGEKLTEEAKEEPSSTENLSTNENIDLPPKEIFGKGKRARIPNKRYSDIALTPTHKKHVENGETNLNDMSNSTPRMSSPAAKPKEKPLTPTPMKKQKINININNPNYLKPFDFGWKRELVYRASLDNSQKRNGDVYYYTPSGKKVRSMREVSENLKNKELTLDDFTFFKEPLGLEDPEREIIREAKLKTAVGGVVTKKTLTPKTPKTPKPSSPKQAPAVSVSPDAETPKAKSPPKVGGFKVKLPSKSERATRGKAAKKDGLDIGTYPPDWSTPPKRTSARWSNLDEMDNKPCRPCSIRCQGVTGLVPTLQCRLCLCLYHNECVGILKNQSVEGYVCKNCQLDLEQKSGPSATISNPPPLTFLNVTKTPTSQPTPNLPKLQRMQRPGEQNNSNVSKSVMPKLTPKPGMVAAKAGENASEQRSLVGSVTTWFPPTSTIQVGELKSPESGIIPNQIPQFVEIVGNKKYLVVPTHNIVAVSPNIASTPNRKQDENESLSMEVASYFPNLPESEPEGATVKMDTDEIVSLNPKSDLTGDFNNVSCMKIESFQHNPTTNDEEKKNHLTTEPSTSIEQETDSPKRKKVTPKVTGGKPKNEVKRPEESKFMDNYLQNLCYGYQALLYVFQYLKVQDLLRAGCVCTMWRDLASHPSLWRTVRMKNSQVHKFDGLARTLNKHGTVHLDLRKMLLPTTTTTGSGDDIWPLFSSAIKQVESLRKIELCRCPASVVEQLAISNPNLEVLNAVTIKCETMNLEPLKTLVNIQELRLKSTAGLTLTSDITALKELKQLKHLSLTSIRFLNNLNINVIANLTKLESLDLGECTDFPITFGTEILSKLENLEKLRLEKGQGNCYTFEILEAVKNMPKLEQLELVNFDIKNGFDKALGACTNIKKLLIIPTYICQSATTNHMVLGGVLRLQSTLSHFVWGVTLELLRVTELFVDQCEDPDKKDKNSKKTSGNGDSIPVLKPVPLLGENMDFTEITRDPPQVEILPLPNLQKLLLQNLPTTRVKILKIPFHATWRQSITDTVN